MWRPMTIAITAGTTVGAGLGAWHRFISGPPYDSVLRVRPAEARMVDDPLDRFHGGDEVWSPTAGEGIDPQARLRIDRRDPEPLTTAGSLLNRRRCSKRLKPRSTRSPRTSLGVDTAAPTWEHFP